MYLHRTNAKAKGPRLFRITLALLVLFLSGSIYDSAVAQELPASSDQVEFTIVVPVTGAVKLSEMSSMDLTNLSASSWKAIRKGHIQLLRSSDERLREQALQNLIFFAKMYRDQVDLTRATPMLYRIYQSDENEDHRVMALVALRAIGIRSVIKLLREDVRWETSERVRKHTLLALADYDKKQGLQ